MRENDVVMYDERGEMFKKMTGFDFELMYSKYYPKLVYYVNKFYNDIQKSEDITTESFLCALEKIETYDVQKAQFSTWLFTIARNITLQHKKLDNKLVSIDIEFDNECTSLKDFIQDSGEENDIMNIKEMKANLMVKYINELKSPYKEIMQMREIQRMSYRDISDTLNEHISTCKSRIRNGRRILIKKVKNEFIQIDKMYL